jgi:FMNH2-dependent dimethyl sulfone monooxygenase
MRYGFWLPVFGGWLRNVDDEKMEASWEYVRDLAKKAETIGYDLTLIAELNLNDIKGVDAPSLDAWSTTAALAAVTERLELMVAVRPTFHNPALLAKQAASIDRMSHGRMRRPSMAFTSMSMTIAMRGRPSGSMLSMDAGRRRGFLIKATTTM